MEGSLRDARSTAITVTTAQPAARTEPYAARDLAACVILCRRRGDVPLYRLQGGGCRRTPRCAEPANAVGTPADAGRRAAIRRLAVRTSAEVQGAEWFRRRWPRSCGAEGLAALLQAGASSTGFCLRARRSIRRRRFRPKRRHQPSCRSVYRDHGVRQIERDRPRGCDRRASRMRRPTASAAKSANAWSGRTERFVAERRQNRHAGIRLRPRNELGGLHLKETAKPKP